MDELYELTAALDYARAQLEMCRAELKVVHDRNILLEAELHRAKQLLDLAELPMPEGA